MHQCCRGDDINLRVEVLDYINLELFMIKRFNPGFNVNPHGSHYFGVDLLITTCLSVRKYTLIQKALPRMTAKLTGVVHLINNLTTSVCYF